MARSGVARAGSAPRVGRAHSFAALLVMAAGMSGVFLLDSDGTGSRRSGGQSLGKRCCQVRIVLENGALVDSLMVFARVTAACTIAWRAPRADGLSLTPAAATLKSPDGDAPLDWRAPVEG